tara:strand:- start:1804 stop:2277 length:474 start_codon:yes stop_codon:yes gene_type:complete
MEIKNPILLKHGLTSISQKQKYDRFVQLYMINFNAKESYREVYDTTNEGTINLASHKLMKHPYIISQLQKKNKIMDEKMGIEALMTRKRVLEELELVLNKTKDAKKHDTVLKALDQISKVIGAYAPVKNEVDHKGVTINYVKPNNKNEPIPTPNKPS